MYEYKKLNAYYINIRNYFTTLKVLQVATGFEYGPHYHTVGTARAAWKLRFKGVANSNKIFRNALDLT